MERHTLLLDDASLPIRESFCWWWVRRLLLFPVREWSPCECSPVLLVGDFRFLVEFEDFAGVRVNAVDKLLEGLEAEVFLFEKRDDCLSLVSVSVKHTWQEGGGGVESYVQLVVEEVRKVAVDFHKLFPSIEGQDVIGGVGGRGGVHCACKNADC